jgi:CRP-like cAMP-binding protein
MTKKEHLECMISCGLLRYIRKADLTNACEQLNITVKKYQKNETVVHQGDIIDSICIIEEGSIRREKTYPSGDVHLVNIYEGGRIFAMEIAVSRKKTSPVDLIANEDSRVLFISLKSIEHSAYRDDLSRALIEMLADDNIRMNNKIQVLAERGLRDRILIYLNTVSRRHPSGEIHIKMNQEQMAQYLCVNRSALSNELNKMKREGLIDYKKSRFWILDQKKEQDEQ